MKFHHHKLFIRIFGKPLRLSQNKKIAGFCAGLAECFNVNVNAMRIIWVLLSLFFGVPLVVYFFAMLILAESTDIEP